MERPLIAPEKADKDGLNLQQEDGVKRRREGWMGIMEELNSVRTVQGWFGERMQASLWNNIS